MKQNLSSMKGGEFQYHRTNAEILIIKNEAKLTRE